MSEKNKLPPGSDPEATITGPLRSLGADPDATISGPLVARADDPDATISGPLVARADDPDATISGPLVRDPDATVSGPLVRDPEQTVARKDSAAPKVGEMPPKAAKDDDPEATFSGPLTQFDPDATISNPGGIRRRANPFAPKALPEALQANLAALGGLNSLIAYANPIFSAVPQISAARTHPDPARLKETVQDLIEAFEAGANKSGSSDETVEGAVFALCCLADDVAAATPWGKEWAGNGLLKEMRNQENGAQAFFELVVQAQKEPEKNADLLEFLYICMALGFQGRFRDGSAEGSAELGRIRAELHALVTRRRGRPDALSERWRPAKVPPDVRESGSARAPWRTIVAPAFALLLLFVGYKIAQRTSEAPESPSTSVKPVAVAPAPSAATPVAPAPAVASAPVAASLTAKEMLEKELSTELKSGVLKLADKGSRTLVSIADERQFPFSQVEPSAAVKTIVERIASALDRVAGPVIVRGFADNVPVRPGVFASNVELSEARAKAVAGLLSARLAVPGRVTAEGAGENEPLAPNDSEDNRAKNRRIEILVGPPK